MYREDLFAGTFGSCCGGVLARIACERRLCHYDNVSKLQTRPHVIYKAKYGGDEVVLKAYHIANKTDVKTVRREVLTLQQLSHPNIIKAQALFLEKSAGIGEKLCA